MNTLMPYYNHVERKQQRYWDKRNHAKEAIEEVNDEGEKQRELAARELADRKALRNTVQPH